MVSLTHIVKAANHLYVSTVLLSFPEVEKYSSGVPTWTKPHVKSRSRCWSNKGAQMLLERGPSAVRTSQTGRHSTVVPSCHLLEYTSRFPPYESSPLRLPHAATRRAWAALLPTHVVGADPGGHRIRRELAGGGGDLLRHESDRRFSHAGEPQLHRQSARGTLGGRVPEQRRQGKPVFTAFCRGRIGRRVPRL